MSYDCDSGFNLNGGSIVRSCLSSGNWSGSEPECIGMWLTSIIATHTILAQVVPSYLATPSLTSQGIRHLNLQAVPYVGSWFRKFMCSTLPFFVKIKYENSTP